MARVLLVRGFSEWIRWCVVSYFRVAHRAVLEMPDAYEMSCASVSFWDRKT
jgi:uncharacterized membrane protein YhdT